MQKKNPKAISRKKVQKESSNRFATYTSLLVCVLILVGGFFFAAQQHFTSIEYSMKNSRLRKQLEDLQAEKRRLLFSREVALSPNEIKKAAKRTGLLNDQPQPVAVPQIAAVRPKPSSPVRVEEKPALVKTSSVRASAPAVQAVQAVSRPEKTAKPKPVSE